VADTAGAAAAGAVPCKAPAETAGPADATGAAEALLAVADDTADDDIDVVARPALVLLVLANPPGRTLRVAPALAARRLGAPGARGSVFLGMGCGGVCG
jgi:hypothetical protein